MQAEDQQDRGRQEVGDLGQLACSRLFGFLRARNIASMRLVTRKPPTTLIVATTTARNPSDRGDRPVAVAGGEDGTDDRDARDRVRPGHQRRVEERAAPWRNDFEPDEERQRTRIVRATDGSSSI